MQSGADPLAKNYGPPPEHIDGVVGATELLAKILKAIELAACTESGEIPLAYADDTNKPFC